ncbi:MAG: hypothetical protein ACRD43_10235 [Pyrinomonadaceae bacterium]
MVETAFTLSEGANAIDQLRDAWSHTRNLRENDRCSDGDLAVAEHYLYARYYVAENGYTGWAYMQTLITGYNTIKMAGGRGILPETGKCPVTPFSQVDVDWSFRGSDDGLRDYRNGSKTKLDLKAPGLPLKPFENT